MRVPLFVHKPLMEPRHSPVASLARVPPHRSTGHHGAGGGGSSRELQSRGRHGHVLWLDRWDGQMGSESNRLAWRKMDRVQQLGWMFSPENGNSQQLSIVQDLVQYFEWPMESKHKVIPWRMPTPNPPSPTQPPHPTLPPLGIIRGLGEEAAAAAGYQAGGSPASRESKWLGLQLLFGCCSGHTHTHTPHTHTH